MKCLAFTDGAARGNPGESGIGVVVKDENGAVLATVKRYLGTATNNQAEYTALLALLEFLRTADAPRCTELVVHTDSELMARQYSGQYKVKDPGLKVLYENVKLQVKQAPFTVTVRHIPRAQNAEADRLANDAIDLRA